MEQLLQKVYNQENLEEAEMKQISEAIFKGEVSEPQISAFLMALKIKGETTAEMVGIAEAMQSVSLKIPYSGADTMDNCGTGGDKSNSFNISTTAAFVLAAAGIKVAKHGNRSISSQSGSADVCQALGIDINLAPDAITYLLDQVGIAFIFAPHVHPNMKYVMGVRKVLATPTIFNLIGPLTNPVKLRTQLMGIYRRDLLEQTAVVLGKLGRERAIVVNGAGYLDEASLAGENHYALLSEGKVSMHVITPEEVGLHHYPLEAIKGRGPEENAKTLRAILAGEQGAPFETVLLNAGLGLLANGKVTNVRDGVVLARELILSGQAEAKLNELLQMQKEVMAG